MKRLLSPTGLADTLRRPSAIVLVAVNLLLIAGVIAWDWSVLEIVFLYWVENLVIGVINVLRMAVSSPDSAPDRITIKGQRFPAGQRQIDWSRAAHQAFKLFIIPFFIVHYGGFCYVHGIFVLAMFGGENGPSLSLEHALSLMSPALTWAIALLAASHLFSFFLNFLGGGEYRRTNAAALMMRPYGRIVALHLTILLGALLVELFGGTLGLLIVLVITKTIADLALHEAEREKLGAKEQ